MWKRLLLRVWNWRPDWKWWGYPDLEGNTIGEAACRAFVLWLAKRFPPEEEKPAGVPQAPNRVFIIIPPTDILYPTISKSGRSCDT